MSGRENHPLQGVMATAMKELKEMVDVNTIIGDPITAPDGTTILPVSKVNFGFASGGSDFATKAHRTNEGPTPDNLCFGGGSGAGVSIVPIAFLVVSPEKGVSLIPIDQSATSAFDKVIEKAPDLIEKAKTVFSKKETAQEE